MWHVSTKKGNNMPEKKCLVVLSGGLDSTVTAYKLLSDGYKLRAVYIDYGKPVSIKERSSARLISFYLDTPLEVIEFPGFTTMELGYMPWERVKTDGPDGAKGTDHIATITENAERYLSAISAARKDWFKISGFHTLISLITYLSQILGYEKAAIGITKEQIDNSSGLKSFLSGWSNLVRELNPEGGKFEILMPLEKLVKAEIVKLGAKLHVPFEATWSCSNASDEYQCGVCVRCIERREGFKLARVEDKTKYLG
jgi:7-cyano-7-deazaguanine synthase